MDRTVARFTCRSMRFNNQILMLKTKTKVLVCTTEEHIKFSVHLIFL